ncbi:MAG: PqqD family protein [Bacteroidales bacterium]|nr:PqqD family protein [Lachnoclostridium sp.]MCM1383622.1 PqqD family protein [Lachnoclostridium sp.]MCM1465704.1 PqqD family protein [Bacteroidales bacterium]
MTDLKNGQSHGGGLDRYMLRQAAGLYWLLDKEQDGRVYQSPLPLNAMGAFIFQMMQQGMEREQIADRISGKYQVEKETALQDIIRFDRQLREQGICEAGHSKVPID